MNTHSISYSTQLLHTAKPTRLVAPRALDISRRLARLALAGSAALLVIIAAAWMATTPSVNQYLSAGLWALGFAFFALALEVNIKRVLPLIATGIALPVLALLGSRLFVGFSILAAAVVAGWIFTWITRRD